MNKQHSIIIQSRIITAARYDYSVQEQRIIFHIIDLLQQHTEGKVLKQKYQLAESLFGDFDFTLPLTAFMKENEQNHTAVKTALKSLNSKSIEIETSKKWLMFNVIERPEFNKEEGSVTFRIHPLLAEAFLDFSKGYSKYSLEIIKDFKSIYAMRFYMLFSTQAKTIQYGVETLKLMFGIEDKYVGKTSDFERYVIKPAKNELDSICPISFNYAKYPEKGKIKGYTFYPYKTGIKDPVMENDLKNQMSIHWDLDLLFINYLKENFNFVDSQLKTHIELLKTCASKLDDFAMTLSKIKASANKNPPHNLQGYLINALKQQLKPEASKKAKSPKLVSNNPDISNSLKSLAKSKTTK